MSKEFKANPKSSLLVFKAAMLATCKLAGIELEELQLQHLAVFHSEFGKLEAADGKQGLLKINAKVTRASQSGGVTVELAGKGAHPSIRFQAEADHVTALCVHFPVKVEPSDASLAYLCECAERIVARKQAAIALEETRKQEASKAAVAKAERMAAIEAAQAAQDSVPAEVGEVFA